MPLYAIDDLETGMVLSKDIKDRSGRTLLKADMALQDKHLKILKTWGISFVEIQGDETQADLQEIIDKHPELIDQAQKQTENLFLHVDKGHAFFCELIPLREKQIIRDLAKKL